MHLQSALFGGVYEAKGRSSGKDYAIKARGREVSCVRLQVAAKDPFSELPGGWECESAALLLWQLHPWLRRAVQIVQ